MRRKSGVREGTQAAMTPKETSTQDQSWGRDDVSVEKCQLENGSDADELTSQIFALDVE